MVRGSQGLVRGPQNLLVRCNPVDPVLNPSLTKQAIEELYRDPKLATDSLEEDASGKLPGEEVQDEEKVPGKSRKLSELKLPEPAPVEKTLAAGKPVQLTARQERHILESEEVPRDSPPIAEDCVNTTHNSVGWVSVCGSFCRSGLSCFSDRTRRSSVELLPTHLDGFVGRDIAFTETPLCEPRATHSHLLALDIALLQQEGIFSNVTWSRCGQVANRCFCGAQFFQFSLPCPCLGVERSERQEVCLLPPPHLTQRCILPCHSATPCHVTQPIPTKQLTEDRRQAKRREGRSEKKSERKE